MKSLEDLLKHVKILSGYRHTATVNCQVLVPEWVTVLVCQFLVIIIRITPSIAIYFLSLAKEVLNKRERM